MGNANGARIVVDVIYEYRGPGGLHTYQKVMQESVERFGGLLLASEVPAKIHGPQPQSCTVWSFPSDQYVQSWQNSSGVALAFTLREGSESSVFSIAAQPDFSKNLPNTGYAVLNLFSAVTDWERFDRDYVPYVPPSLEGYGWYLGRDRAPVAIHGTPPIIAVLLGFPTRKRATTWRLSARYTAVLPTRNAVSDSVVFGLARAA